MFSVAAGVIGCKLRNVEGVTGCKLRNVEVNVVVAI